MNDVVRLTRELRFGIEPGTLGPRGNGFAGNPGLEGLGAFFLLRATVAGAVDPATGMLVNIKEVDRALRDVGVPHIRRAFETNEAPARAVAGLLTALRDAFAPHQLKAVELAPSPFLCFSQSAKEAGVLRVSLRFEFSAAHRLHADTLSDEDNRTLFGRCNNPSGHGHNYELEVTVAGEPDVRGNVISIQELQSAVNEHVIDVFDHKHLNVDCPDFAALNPTVENIARVIWGRLHGHVPGKLVRIRVWETPKTVCEYEG
jgi:6-pyruvoyltetrahydropterin/6-carboxytetrahydropterin synthase